jgi:NAD(P)H-nitrite reductase large subunit
VYVQEKFGGTVYVREKLKSVSQHSQPLTAGIPGSIVIVGGGAAGNAAAEMLRREGYFGRITMLSADESVPCDRPNLSKASLSGAASDESNPLRSQKFYRDHKIDLHLGARAAAIDTAGRQVRLADAAVTPMTRCCLLQVPSRYVSTSPGQLSHTCIIYGLWLTAARLSPALWWQNARL